MPDAPASSTAIAGRDADANASASWWKDLGAGLCVAGLLLPEAVAYAGLARLPVVHALTAMMVGLALDAAFGGSRCAIAAPRLLFDSDAVGSVGVVSVV